MIRTTINRIGALFLVAALLLGQAMPSWAADTEDGIEAYEALDSDINTISLDGGDLYEAGFKQGETHHITLGPEEEGLFLTVTPTELNFPPTLELFEGDTLLETLTPGKTSLMISVPVDATRTIRLTSTAHSPLQDGTYRTSNYEFQIHRTSTKFQWKLGEPLQTENGAVLPVTLNGPVGLEIKTLMFALGFNPAKLQLCDVKGAVSTGLYKFLPYAEGFHYKTSTSSGYFKDLAATISNENGRLAVQFGAATTELNNNSTYQVTAEKETLFTVYFKVMEQSASANDIFVLTDDLDPTSGISVMERCGTEFFSSENAGMVEVVGSLPPTETHSVTLPGTNFPGGTVTAQPAQTSFLHGETLTLIAAPISGYTFSGWNFGSTGLSGSGATLTITVNSDLDLTTLTPQFSSESILPDNTQVDLTAPYGGTVLLATSGLGTAAKSRSISAAEESFSEMDVDRNGLTVLDFHDSSEETRPANVNARVPHITYTLGAKANFKMRDTRVTQSTAGNPAWPVKEFELKAIGTGVNIWFATENKMAVSDAQFAELVESFDTSLSWLNTHCGTVYDRNANGKLDVLLYDVQDVYTNGGSNSYVAGLTNVAELYGAQGTRGSVGNDADVVHLDTWPAMGTLAETPDLSIPISTFAHEAQHLASFSVDSVRKQGQSNAEIMAANPPTWINEGLAMAAEHALFGVRSSRINTFNTSNAIKNGYSLTEWGDKLEDYALSYLFVEYLLAQSKDTYSDSGAFLKQFYTDYQNDWETTALAVIQSLPQFQDMSLNEVIACFYAALYLQTDSGVYGFEGDDAFRSARPQVASAPKTSLPATAGVYSTLRGEYTPPTGNGLTYLGLTAPEITLSATADKGGTVSRNPSQASYNRDTPVMLTATPDEGYVFSGWTGDVTGENTSVTVTMDRSKSVHATFAVDSAAIEPLPVILAQDILPGAVVNGTTATATDAKGNTVTLTTTGDINALTVGTPIVLTATPAKEQGFLYWETVSPPAEGKSLPLEGGNAKMVTNPLATTAQAGLSYRAEFGILAAETGTQLGRLEPVLPEDRRLVYTLTDGSGKTNFGLQQNIYTYDLYFLTGESRAQFAMSTDRTVTAISVVDANGNILTMNHTDPPTPNELKTRVWHMTDGQPLSVTLARETQEGTVTIVLTSASGIRTYTVALHRVTANPGVGIGLKDGFITLSIHNAHFRTVSISLTFPAGTIKRTDTEIAADLNAQLAEDTGTQVAKVRVGVTAERRQVLEIIIDAAITGLPCKVPINLRLFSGNTETLASTAIHTTTDRITGELINENIMSDARFGTLYDNTKVEGIVTVTGSVRSYNGKNPVTILVNKLVGGNYEFYTGFEMAKPEKLGYTAYSQDFALQVDANCTYQITLTKLGHATVCVENFRVGEASISLLTDFPGELPADGFHMTCGDVDKNDRVNAFDKAKLTDLAHYGQATTTETKMYDLDGDERINAFDLAILTAPENYYQTINHYILKTEGAK